MENIFVEFLPPWVETGLQPAFYDKESGTALQQTARMYARVNMLIRMFNKLSKNTKETVEDYINKFNELYTYVHDYFDNLDVQEEINNKLDAMVEAGTLQEIITQYIQANVAWTFDSVADMKLSENLVNGSYAQTLGYHAKNDGGAGLYYIDANGTADEASIIAIGDSLKAHLILLDEIIAEQFGAYGDDTHDDAVAIQKALDYGNTNGLPVKLIINKVYKINSTLTALSDFIMDGQLHYTGTAVAVNIGDPDNRATNKTFKLNIVSDNAVGTANSVGAKMYNLYQSDINIYHVENFYKGVQLIGINSNGFVYNKIKIVAISNYFIGLELVNDVGGWVNENQFYGGRICNFTAQTYYQAGTAIKLTSNVTYLNNCNVFYAPCVEGNAVGIDFDYARLNKVYDVRCEGVTTAVKFAHDANSNYVKLGYGNPTTSGMTRPNIVISSEEYVESFYTKQIFDSGYISAGAVHCSNGGRIAKLISYVNNAVDPRIRCTIVDNEYVAGSDSLLACVINLDTTDKTVLLKQNVEGDGNRFAVVSFDSDGNVINEAPKQNLGGTFSSYTSTSLGSTLYRTGNNTTNDVILQMPSTATKCIVGVINPSNRKMSNLQFYVKVNSKSFVSYPFANTVYPVSDRIPDTAGLPGQVCLSSESTENGWRYDGSAWVAF